MSLDSSKVSLLSALKSISKVWVPEYLWVIVYTMEKSLTVIKMNKTTFLHGSCQKFSHKVNCIRNTMKSFVWKESPFSFSVTDHYLPCCAPWGTDDIPAFHQVFAWFCLWHSYAFYTRFRVFYLSFLGLKPVLRGGIRVYAGYVWNVNIQEISVALKSPRLLLWQTLILQVEWGSPGVCIGAGAV